MNEVVKILEKYDINGTMKIHGTDKSERHNYSESYSRLLSKYKDSKTSFLEIGICFGASILLWQKLLPLSHIYGIDVVFCVRHRALKHIDLKRFDWFIGDAYSKSIKTKLLQKCSKFDIIIDDGPHSIESQLSSISMYLPCLNSNGIFVVEDIQDIDKNKESLVEMVNSFEGCTYEIIDLRSENDIYDDVLFVIHKE